ncbi:MAG: hypothetical protein V3S85_00275, partial [Nitrospirales bacterium]
GVFLGNLSRVLVPSLDAAEAFRVRESLDVVNGAANDHFIDAGITVRVDDILQGHGAAALPSGLSSQFRRVDMRVPINLHSVILLETKSQVRRMVLPVSRCLLPVAPC